MKSGLPVPSSRPYQIHSNQKKVIIAELLTSHIVEDFKKSMKEIPER